MNNPVIKSYGDKTRNRFVQEEKEQECPICMDFIEGINNRVTTECGHIFHCTCLMHNVAQNGFGCPYCRTKMADEPEDDEDEDGEEYDDEYVYEYNDDYDDEEEDDEDNNILISFRMFQQRINDEELEDEPEVEEEVNEPTPPITPTQSFVCQKLIERGVTMEDLVKSLLYIEQDDYANIDYCRKSSEIRGKINTIIQREREERKERKEREKREERMRYFREMPQQID